MTMQDMPPFSATPPPPARRCGWWCKRPVAFGLLCAVGSWAALFLITLIVAIIASIGGHLAPASPASVSHAASALPQAPADPPARIALDDSDWTQLGELSGEGNKVTKPFSARLPWRVRWEAKAGTNIFVHLCAANGDMIGGLVNEIGPKTGVAYAEDNVRDAYLKIEHDGPWHLVIEQK